MSSTTIDISRTGFSSEVFEQFLATRVEPSWITDARRVAFEQYQTLLHEELDPEEFKRVDLRVFNAGKFRPTSGEADSSVIATLLSDKTEFGGSIAHVNGQVTQSTCSDAIKAQGVLFGELQALLTSHRELLEPYFMKQAVKRRPTGSRHGTLLSGPAVLSCTYLAMLKSPCLCTV